MTLDDQRKAFDLELHALIMRFLDQFDLPAEDILELMVREEMFLIYAACENAGDDESTEDWQSNGNE